MTTNANQNWIVIVAGGSSERFGKDKLTAEYLGIPLLCHTVKIATSVTPNVVVVARKDCLEQYRELLGDEVILTTGGQTRSQSVGNGLAILPPTTNLVAIQDGARPFVSRKLYQRLFDSAQIHGCAIPAIKATDTTYDLSAGTPRATDRSKLLCAQTPQVFDFKKLCQAYKNSPQETDDGQVWLKKYGYLHFEEGERNNIKVTYPQDLTEYKIGVGFDAHRLKEGRKLLLCGVEIPYSLGLEGHSDADVAFHALSDAILSAIGEKDIGNLFPDSDPKYLGVDSGKLLEEVWRRATEKGFCLQNASLTIMAQKPKLSPYIELMKRNVARILQATTLQVNVSATTTENLGITAEGKGMACHANVLLIKHPV